MKHDPLFEFQRTGLETLKLAADAILSEAEDCGEVVPNALEAALVIFRQRIIRALLVPDDATDIYEPGPDPATAPIAANAGRA